MNKKFGLMNNSPGGGKVENLTAKFGGELVVEPPKISQTLDQQPQFLNKRNLKQIPDISNKVCEDENFSIYDNYTAPEISNEQKSKQPTLRSKKAKELSTREKAIMFAKNVPKPK
jgi:hypothetical protein